MCAASERSGRASGTLPARHASGELLHLSVRFLESGLLESGDGTLYGAKRAKIDGKADLEATEIMRRLREFQQSS